MTSARSAAPLVPADGVDHLDPPAFLALLELGAKVRLILEQHIDVHLAGPAEQQGLATLEREQLAQA